LIDPSSAAIESSGPELPGTLDVATERGFRQAYVHRGRGGLPLLLVHGWPSTSRIWARNLEPLGAAGFEVIAPDLRGFGASELGPDGFHDVPAHSRDLYSLVHDHLGHAHVVAAGCDLGGAVVQDLSLRHPGFVTRLIVAVCPLPSVPGAMDHLRPPGPTASNHGFRPGTDPDGLLAELDTPRRRVAFVAGFYQDWSGPGAFRPEEVEFLAGPFADPEKLRASFGTYESLYHPTARSERTAFGGRTNPTRALILMGLSDPVVYPDFDRKAAIVFPDHVGPILIRDCGHFLPWEAATIFNDLVSMFCADLLLGGRIAP
jgi:pimeloyl-ACP methyl ester carboxylesterase